MSLNYGRPYLDVDLDRIVAANLNWAYFKNSTILISGASGFLPSHLVFTFHKLNQEFDLNIKIIALVRNRDKASRKFHMMKENFIEIIEHDVTLPFSYKGEIHIIIHAASQASPRYYGIDPVGTLSANVLGTDHLLKLAFEKKVKEFLFFSSGEVYGQVPEEMIPTKENQYGYINPAEVRSCYAESKRMGETMCVSWNHQYKVPVKIVRPFHTYGPGMLLDDGRVFSDFVKNIVQNENIIMKSDGSARRAFCYITDAVIGFLTVLTKGENARPYNIGNSDQEVSVGELAAILVDLFKEKKLSVIRQSIKEDLNYMKSPISRNCPDTEAALALGWKPEVTIQVGFKQTVQSFYIS
jgi:UDP-glucuronate decarboxylase